MFHIFILKTHGSVKDVDKSAHQQCIALVLWYIHTSNQKLQIKGGKSEYSFVIFQPHSFVVTIHSESSHRDYSNE